MTRAYNAPETEYYNSANILERFFNNKCKDHGILHGGHGNSGVQVLKKEKLFLIDMQCISCIAIVVENY